MLDKECNLMPKKVNKETRELISKINRAFRDYSMLSNGDRVIVAMSGGHDSMSLLRLLEMRKALTPERYDLIAVHIIGDSRGPNETPIHEPHKVARSQQIRLPCHANANIANRKTAHELPKMHMESAHYII